MIDLSREGLADGVRRIMHGRGVDVVVDGVGGPVTGLAPRSGSDWMRRQLQASLPGTP